MYYQDHLETTDYKKHYVLETYQKKKKNLHEKWLQQVFATRSVAKPNKEYNMEKLLGFLPPPSRLYIYFWNSALRNRAYLASLRIASFRSRLPANCGSVSRLFGRRARRQQTPFLHVTDRPGAVMTDGNAGISHGESASADKE